MTPSFKHQLGTPKYRTKLNQKEYLLQTTDIVKRSLFYQFPCLSNDNK